MKTIRKTHKLNLEKFQISKLNNLHNIIGGRANNPNVEEEEEEKEENTTTIWTTTNTIGG